MSDDRTIRGEFEALSEQRCKEFLEVAVVGRLAYAGADHIEIMPVNYIFRDPHLLIRTSAY
ncbi:MAG: pyridoxamine 5'-phosphate oxidase family protein, partial [Actinomycetia bacterium]|nr:pyridoxamine 5'-phosphate oxidase family protein [Actinomycetes bacterium]